MIKKLFTSESVTDGHPDKVCDAIADSVLDKILEEDPYARVACECAATTGMVIVMGEVTTSCYVDIPRLVRDVAMEIGYDKPEYGFDGHTLAVISAINNQSADIDMGVSKSFEAKSGDNDDRFSIGAGDQGMMFGYACRETESLMPLPIELAHALTRQLAAVREAGILPELLPDGKAQVTVQYEDGVPAHIDTVVVSTQHTDSISEQALRARVIDEVILKALPASLLDERTHMLINPTGRFLIGGPAGDSGLPGRKLIVDTYGGYARHGGGAFSGKDPSKVDRSAAYMARYIAKNLVAAGLAKKCQLELAYAIGVAQPVSVLVETFGTGKLPDERLSALVMRCFDLRPAAIIRQLDLRRPIYRQTAAYGHFGRPELDLPWERLDRVDELLKNA